MSLVPLRGRATQAPMASVPTLTPRVAVTQVAPRPIAVAKTSVSKVRKISRTEHPSWPDQFLRAAAASDGPVGVDVGAADA